MTVKHESIAHEVVTREEGTALVNLALAAIGYAPLLPSYVDQSALTPDKRALAAEAVRKLMDSAPPATERSARLQQLADAAFDAVLSGDVAGAREIMRILVNTATSPIEDTTLLDFLDKQWMNPLHIEVNAKGNADMQLRREVSIWQGKHEIVDKDVRAAIRTLRNARLAAKKRN